MYGAEQKVELQNTDRPALMNFIAETGKHGFIFEKKKGLFRLKNWKKVSQFADDILPKWERHFNIYFEGDAKLLKHGQRKLNWEIEARSKKNKEMTLRESFKIGSHRLGFEHSKKFQKLEMELLFYPVMAWCA